eukprot:g9247.t1
MTVLPLLALAIPIAQRHPYNAQQQQQQQQELHQHRHRVMPRYRYRSPLPPPLRAKLRVCTDEDCVQQGAYQTLAALKKGAKGGGIQVDSCPCLGMCGLGPCVSIDWDGSRMEPRGGIDALDDAAIRQIVEDAAKPPQPQTPATQERDPYAEQ